MKLLPRSAALDLALGLAPAVTAAELSVDEIVQRHVEARGGLEALRALRTLVSSQGRYEEGEYEVGQLGSERDIGGFR